MTNSLESFAQLSAEERVRLADLGRGWSTNIHANRDVVLAIYTPLAAKAPKVRGVVRDVPYGPNTRQVLDVFAHEGAKGCDVVIFVHGGAFIRGNKRVNDEIYDNVCHWFARQNKVVVNLEYRLASDAPYPGGAEDVQMAVQWCIENVERFGGNANRMFLVGHSAGATHVAAYLADPVMGRAPASNIIGAISISGRLRADARPDNPNAAGVRAYFGENGARYEERSPVTHVHRTPLPFLVAIAEFENPYLDVYGVEFAYRCAAARGRSPDVVRLLGHNHTSMVAHFNTGEEVLGRRILDFMRSCAAGG